MFKNRLTLIFAALSALFVSLAVASPFSSAPSSTEPSAPIIMPVTGAAESVDYYQRHHELKASVDNLDMTDYFLRHPLPGGLTASVDAAGDRAPLDECFDVSLSEVAQCRESSQSLSR